MLMMVACWSALSMETQTEQGVARPRLLAQPLESSAMAPAPSIAGSSRRRERAMASSWGNARAPPSRSGNNAPGVTALRLHIHASEATTTSHEDYDPSWGVIDLRAAD